LHLEWDSASLANVVCRDFELQRDLEGRTVEQVHTLSGTLRVSQRPDSVVLHPQIADEFVTLKVDLSPRSWADVEQALRTQDTFTRCGLVLDPENVVRQLRGLAARGFRVRLPGVMSRPLQLPVAIGHQALIEGRPVTVSVRTRSFEATPRLVWSRAAVGIEAAPPGGPGPGPLSAQGRPEDGAAGSAAGSGQSSSAGARSRLAGPLTTRPTALNRDP
jgi:hypothetical protein